MKKRNLIIGIGTALLLAGGLFLLLGCGGEGGAGVSYPSYGGTDPKGDFIVVMLDRNNSKVKKINYTLGETESSQPWYDYTAIAANTPQASGFSIVKSIDIGDGAYVLFAEYPDAVCVFQAFTAVGIGDGNPVFLVYRDAADKSSFYSRAYNWVKLLIDTEGSGADSDVSCGFAAFDASGKAGKMYGAAYSKLENWKSSGDVNGVSNINEGGGAGIDALAYDAGSMAFCMWNGSVGDWSNAVAITGTATGALVLDWGQNVGGGGAIAVPQTSAVDDLPTFFTAMAGTYLTMTYGYVSNYQEERGPVKVVIDSDGTLNVYDFGDRTDTGDPYTDEPLALTSVEDFEGGPVMDEDIVDTFYTVAGNGEAESTVVQNAHLCRGAFLGTYGDILMMIGFDPSGRFFGFTLFDDLGDGVYAVRSGIGIKDEDYDNAMVPD